MVLLDFFWFQSCAEVAELVDALGSGSSGRTLVEVRVFSSAPPFLLSRNLIIRLRLFYCLNPLFCESVSSLNHNGILSKKFFRTLCIP